MFSIQTFSCEGGPLDGQTVELFDEDTMHPDTVSLRIIGVGTYNRARHASGWVMRWTPAETLLNAPATDPQPAQVAPLTSTPGGHER